jgi:hypothetical protein
LDLTPLLVASNGSSRRRMGNTVYSVGHQRDAVHDFTTLPANGGSSSSSSVQSRAVVPLPLLLPPEHPDTVVGWSGASSGLDTSQLDSSHPEQLLLDADQLQVLQLQQRDMSGVPVSCGVRGWRACVTQPGLWQYCPPAWWAAAAAQAGSQQEGLKAAGGCSTGRQRHSKSGQL